MSESSSAFQKTPAPGASSRGASSRDASLRNGFTSIIGTYLIWGMLPLYFVLMAPASPVEIVVARVVFSLVFCALLLPLFKATGPFLKALRSPRIMLILTAASFLICANWLIYVMATTTGHTIDVSLGYFINPLVSVVLGVLFLQERLRTAQWISVGISCLAVLIMSLVYGQVPWTGLGVAFTFGIYGLLKARVAHDVNPLVSLSLETLILAPFGIAALLFLNARGQMTLLSEGAGHFWLLASTGAVTVVPLMLFAASTKLLPLSVIGMVQYLGPTIQFILAITVLHERMSPDKALGLGLIWVALIIFTVDALHASRSSRPSSVADPITGMIPVVRSEATQEPAIWESSVPGPNDR